MTIEDKKFTEIKPMTEKEKQEALKEIVIERIKQMPDNLRLSIG